MFVTDLYLNRTSTVILTLLQILGIVNLNMSYNVVLEAEVKVFNLLVLLKLYYYLSMKTTSFVL